MESTRQQEIYDFIVRYANRYGYPPTVREIGAEVGLASPSTVHAHLMKLEKAGYLRRDPSKPRALELVGRSRQQDEARDDVAMLPVVGQIAAGGPILAEENIDEYVAVPAPLSRGAGEDFVLRVRGDSMRDAGILDEDYLVVRQQETATNGEIVAALVGDDAGANEATVKRFFRENNRVRLQPDNPHYEPTYPEHIQLLGRVTGVFRQL